MDYGKMAYLKAEDLEARMTGTQESARTVKAAFNPRAPLKNRFDLTEIVGNGASTAVLKITLRAEADTVSTLKVYYGDKSIADAAVKLVKAEEKDYVMLCCLYAEEGAYIGITADNGAMLTLMRAELIVLGNAEIGRGAVGLSYDTIGSKAGIINITDEVIEGIAFDESLEKFYDGVFVGHGHRADIVAVDGGYIVAYCDNNNNLWGVHLDGDMNTLSTYLFDNINVGVISLYRYGNKIVVVYTQSGQIWNFMTDIKLSGRSQAIVLDFGMRADGVAFVKNAPYPMLMIYSDGKSFLKTAEPEKGFKTDLTVSLVATVTGVNNV